MTAHRRRRDTRGAVRGPGGSPSNKGRILDWILSSVRRGPQYWVLLDPDDHTVGAGADIARKAEDAGADVVLVGGSLLRTSHLDEFVSEVRSAVHIPVVLFPGDATQVSRHADALLFLSLVSGRNPVNLIGEHVKAAFPIKRMGIEPIPTAYLLIESGMVTSVEFMSDTRPIPRAKPMIAAAHALAAQYMGMKLIYLEAGSGAREPVPNDMIAEVKKQIEIPVIVGGGIRDAKTAEEKVASGADIIVTGNLLKHPGGVEKMGRIARAVKKG